MSLAPGSRIRIGLFPLSGVVLFPGLPLPLHVFEPRYRSLVRDALDGDELIGMTLLRPGWESDYAGRPPVHSVGGLGRIVRSEPYPDGKFDIVLHGVARFSILEEEDGAAYRIAVAEILEDRLPPAGDPVAGALASALREDAATLHPDAAGTVPEELDLATLSGSVAALLRLPASERQVLLEIDDAVERARRLVDGLAPRAARARALDRLLARGGIQAADLN